jgi:hypothetical protein
MRTDDGVVNQRPLDGPRIVVSAVATAGLGVATAELFVHYYPRTNDVGPTAAALGDAYVVLTAPSDVSFSDALGFAVIAFGPGFVFVAAGTSIGVGLRRLLPQG